MAGVCLPHCFCKDEGKHGARLCKGYLLLISLRNKSVFNYTVSCKELLHLTKTCCSFFYLKKKANRLGGWMIDYDINGH